MTTLSRYIAAGGRDKHGPLWLVLDTRPLVPEDRVIAECWCESDARLIADALNAFGKPRFISQAPMAKAIQ